MRSSYGFPVTAYDGVVLFEDDRAGARTSFLDTELQPGRFYYYSLLVRLADGSWKVAGQTFELVTAGHSNGRKLWELLPEFYREADYDYRGVHDEGPLYRFLDMLGYQVDRTRTEIDTLLDVANIDRVSGGLLPVLAESLGVTYEPELGMRTSRSIIQNAIHLAKTKGTRPGIEGVASAYTSFGASAVVGKNLLFDRNHSGWVDEGLNLFPASQRGFGTGVGTWTNAGNATLDTAADGDDMRLRLTALAAGDVAATTPAGDSGFAVEAGRFYDFVAYAKSVGTSRQVEVSITFYDAAGTAQGTTSSTAAAAQTTSWTRFGVAALAPSGAVYASVGVKVLAAQAADETLVDDVALTQAPVSHWVATQNANLGRRSEVATTPAEPGTGSLVVVGGSLAATDAVVLSGTFADRTLIAVTPGVEYAASISTMHEGTARTAYVGIVYYDIDGVPLLTEETGLLNTGAWQRLSVSSIAPANAAWAAMRLQVATPATGERHLFGAAQLEEGSPATDWESGRQVNVYLEPERRNLVTNPSFENDAAAWSALPGSTIVRSTAEAWSGDAALSVVKDDSEDPTFSRPSTAYLDGVEVASGTPRYRRGQNVLSTNQAAPTVDPPGTSNGWTFFSGVNGAGDASLVENGGALSGGAVRFTWTDAPSGAGGPYINGRLGQPAEHKIEVEGGDTLTASAYVLASQADARIGLVFYDSSGTTIPGNPLQPVVVPTSGVAERVSMTAIVPVDAAYLAVTIYLETPGVGDWIEVSNAQVEIGDTATPWRPGGPSAVLIEEGTTNLLPLNVSDGTESGATTGLSFPNGATGVSSTEQKWQGTRSVKVTLAAGGPAFSGVRVDGGVSLAGNTTYTASAWVYIPSTGGIDVRWSIQGQLATASVNGANVTARDQWVRTTVSFTTDADGGAPAIYLLNGVTAVGGEVFYADGIQLEQKAYATSWQPGGVARGGENHLIPPEVANFTEGSVEVDVSFDYGTVPSTNRIFEIKRASGTNGLLVYAQGSPETGHWVLHVTNDAGAVQTRGIQRSIVGAGWHRFAVTWDATAVRYFVDGVQVGSDMPASALPSTPEVITLGFSASHPSHSLNNPYDAIRFSSRARTATELADASTPLAPDADTTWFQDFAGDLEYVSDSTIGAVADPMPVTEGLTYTGSFLAKGTVPRNIQAAIEWVDVGGSVLATTTGTVVVEVADTWVRASVTGMAPAGAVTARLVAQVVGGAASTDTHFFDGVLFEQTEFVKEYFDASLAPTADYLWDGLPHASASFRYPRRDVKDARLRTVLPDYVPAGVDVKTIYGAEAPTPVYGPTLPTALPFILA